MPGTPIEDVNKQDIDCYRKTGRILFVTLGKQDYNWETIKSFGYPIVPGDTYRLRATVEGERIRVYINGSDEAVIDVCDTSFVRGYAGVRAYECKTFFANIVIAALNR